MKKISKLLALLLALAMVLSMAACGGDDSDSKKKKDDDKGDDTAVTTTEAAAVTDEEAIVGEWAAIFNLSDLLAETLDASFGTELAPKADLNLRLSFEFEADGEGEMTIKIDNASLKTYTNELCENMIAYLYAMGEAAGETKESMDADILAETGMTTEEYVAEQMAATMDAMVGTMSSTTDLLYKVDAENTTIYIGEDQDELDSKKETMTYKLDGKILTISAVTSDGEDASAVFAMVGMELPWILTKQ